MINPKPGKTYKFALVEPESVPFKIVGHDLILVTGVPLDYETTNSTGVGVLVVDSDGTTSQRMFSIRITSEISSPGFCLFFLRLHLLIFFYPLLPSLVHLHHTFFLT